MVKVVWTDAAIEDLDEIGEWIAKDSVKYAERTVEKLFNAPDILEEHPKAGPMSSEFNDETIRQLIRGNFSIVYRIVNEFRIDVMTVHWCARLIENAFDLDEFDE